MSSNENQWVILGIEATTDAAAIRKAYASKLRNTRPDDDPAGFQRLVEARDRAILFARTGDQIDPGEEIRDDVDADIAVVIGLPTTVGTPEVLQILRDLPRETYPVGVKELWTKVFDAVERAPLEQYPLAMAGTLSRLVLALWEDLGPMPERSMLPKSALGNLNLLGPYSSVLGDFERRFNLLQRDTEFFDYLSWDQAWYFTKALEIGAGARILPGPAQPVPFREVLAADQIWAEMAFRSDPQMLELHQMSVAADKYVPSLSPLGLLFPLPVALYYRLYGFAAVAGFFPLCLIAGWIGWALGYAPGIFIALVCYPLVAYMGAMQISSMRIASLGRKVTSLAREGDLRSIAAGVEAWSKPNLMGMAFGVIVVLAAILTVLLIGHPELK